MKQEWIEVTEYSGEGYRPLVDFEAWRVAVLNYCEELLPEQIQSMQKHNETDEVFVLLAGSCMLFTGGLGDQPEEIDFVEMEPYRLYNVKKGVWHTHCLSLDARVLIVENKDTCDENSPVFTLRKDQKKLIMEYYYHEHHNGFGENEDQG